MNWYIKSINDFIYIYIYIYIKIHTYIISRWSYITCTNNNDIRLQEINRDTHSMGRSYTGYRSIIIT